MTMPMANSQMLTSKKPRNAAAALRPRAMKMVRTVDMVTTQVSATKTSSGSITPPSRPAAWCGGKGPRRQASGRGKQILHQPGRARWAVAHGNGRHDGRNRGGLVPPGPAAVNPLPAAAATEEEPPPSADDGRRH